MVKPAFFDLHKIPNFKEIMMNNFDETLKINKTNCLTKRNDAYSIIRYNKNLFSKESVLTTGLIKCLVLNDEKKAIGFAPPKSIDLSDFERVYPEKTDSIVAEEFIDGVMINLFWNPRINIAGGWEIATRNSVGADIFCAGKKTYSTLFKEIINTLNFDINKLDPAFSYSFVMQHPDFSNVTQFSKELYLVEMYEIVQTLNDIILVFQIDTTLTLMSNPGLKFPKKFENWSSYSELKHKFASSNAHYSSKGVVLRNADTGERSKILNPTHLHVQHTLNVGEKELYKYLVFRREGKVKDFLKFYPNEKSKLSLFRDYIHNFTNTLHQNYLDCYVRKTNNIECVSDIFRAHLLCLHEIYICKLLRKKEIITNTVVILYVNTLPVDALFYCLNKPIRDSVNDD